MVNFPASFFAGNRQRVASAVLAASSSSLPAPASQLAVVAGSVTTTRPGSDAEYHFRQESNFWYLTGVKTPGSVVAFNISEAAETTLFVPDDDADEAVWCGAHDPLEVVRSKTGIADVRHMAELEAFLGERKPELVHVLEYQPPVAALRGLTQSDGEVLFRALGESRLFKQECELQVMRATNKISSEVHQMLWKHVRPGMNETELEGVFVGETHKRGCRQQAYTPIVGAGKHASVLHYVHNDAVIGENDLILVDAGGELDMYSSDITRCFPANGRFSNEQREVYETVLCAQQAVLGSIRPGVAWEDMHRLAERVIAEGLLSMGIARGSLEDVLKHHVANVFFPHGLGHLLGLETHDPVGYPVGIPRIAEPGIRYLRFRRNLQPGMVCTVEPGLYFIDQLIEGALRDPVVSQFLDREKIEQYRYVGGVRIEDDVIITETGYENLTSAPKAVEDIERIMAEARA